MVKDLALGLGMLQFEDIEHAKDESVE